MNSQRFADFIQAFTRLVEQAGNHEDSIFAQGQALLFNLISHDDWLPEIFSRANPQGYRQYLLYCDPEERFSVVSFVWGPGQSTPIHDHTVWGLIGVLRGAENYERFERDPNTGQLHSLGAEQLKPADIDRVSPRVGDLHRVANAFDDRDSISIHVYGANIGRVQRHTYDPLSGQTKTFVSGYSNT